MRPRAAVPPDSVEEPDTETALKSRRSPPQAPTQTSRSGYTSTDQPGSFALRTEHRTEACRAERRGHAGARRHTSSYAACANTATSPSTSTRVLSRDQLAPTSRRSACSTKRSPSGRPQARQKTPRNASAASVPSSQRHPRRVVCSHPLGRLGRRRDGELALALLRALSAAHPARHARRKHVPKIGGDASPRIMP